MALSINELWTLLTLIITQTPWDHVTLSMMQQNVFILVNSLKRDLLFKIPLEILSTYTCL